MMRLLFAGCLLGIAGCSLFRITPVVQAAPDPTEIAWQRAISARVNEHAVRLDTLEAALGALRDNQQRQQNEASAQ
jgi:hypothetical protein